MPFPRPQCSSNWKWSLRVHLDYLQAIYTILFSYLVLCYALVYYSFFKFTSLVIFQILCLPVVYLSLFNRRWVSFCSLSLTSELLLVILCWEEEEIIYIFICVHLTFLFVSIHISCRDQWGISDRSIVEILTFLVQRFWQNEISNFLDSSYHVTL